MSTILKAYIITKIDVFKFYFNKKNLRFPV
jgi:hypothetical protein